MVLTILVIALQAPTVEPVTTGYRPRLSPDGKWVAFHRPVQTDDTDLRGSPVWRNEVWIRDVGSGEEKRLAKDAWISGWINSTTLIFRDGTMATTTAPTDPVRVAKLPADFHASNRAWAPGGARMAFIPYIKWDSQSPDPLSRRTIYVADGDAHPKAVELGHSILAEDPGVLAWSPDGKRLAYHQEFFRDGNIPVRRIGVIDISTGANRFVGEGHRFGNRGFSLSERWGDSPGTWDAKGERFVFVTGRGGGEADVYVSNAAGTEVHQLTEDGDCKWSPVLDPAGRRVAFCAGVLKQTNKDPQWPLFDLFEGRIRILDLYTGREMAFAPDRKGVGSNVAWLADGSGVLFDWTGHEIFKSILPTAAKLEAGAAIAAKPALTRKDRILRALKSDSEAIVEWAAEESAAQADADIVSGLRAALARSLKSQQTQSERALLFAISRLNARAAAPEVIGSIHSTYDANRNLALGLVGEWKLAQATEAVLKIVEELPESETNVHAAGALAWLSHESGWKLLERYAKADAKEIRGAVASSLEGLADPRAIGILIGLVDDEAVVYISVGGEHQIGDRAERALARITGVTLARKPIAWMTWWNEVGRRLPAVPTPNPALQKLDEELRRREKEWREKLRKSKGD